MHRNTYVSLTQMGLSLESYSEIAMFLDGIRHLSFFFLNTETDGAGCSIQLVHLRGCLWVLNYLDSHGDYKNNPAILTMADPQLFVRCVLKSVTFDLGNTIGDCAPFQTHWARANVEFNCNL